MLYSAGILPYTPSGKILVGKSGVPEPRYAKRWGILKGKVEHQETIFDAALREFQEESGIQLDSSNNKYTLLGNFVIRHRKVKNLFVFVTEVDEQTIDTSKCDCSTFVQIRDKSYPEVSRLNFFEPKDALRLIYTSQVPIVKSFLLYYEQR